MGGLEREGPSGDAPGRGRTRRSIQNQKFPAIPRCRPAMPGNSMKMTLDRCDGSEGWSAATGAERAPRRGAAFMKRGHSCSKEYPREDSSARGLRGSSRWRHRSSGGGESEPGRLALHLPWRTLSLLLRCFAVHYIKDQETPEHPTQCTRRRAPSPATAVSDSEDCGSRCRAPSMTAHQRRQAKQARSD